MIPIKDAGDNITFAVKLQPRAKRSAVLGEIGEALKVAIAAPPVDGRANQACIEFFADLLDVRRSAVTIVSGQSSRNKVVRVTGISAEAARNKLPG